MKEAASWIRAARVALALPADAQARLLGEGQFCVAVLVEPDIVVRFPRHALGIEHLLHERKLMEILGRHLDVVIPAPLVAELGSPPGQAFACHRLVPGELVRQDSLDDPGCGDMDRLHDQVASLLLGLKAATSAARSVGVRTASLGESAASMAADVDALLRDRMSPLQLARATAELRALAGVDRHDRSLCHTDLGGNLVWDPADRRLGVIDFGGACVSDPVLDLASLLALDASLAAAVAAKVPHIAGRVDDARTVCATFALQDALYGARTTGVTSTKCCAATEPHGGRCGHVTEMAAPHRAPRLSRLAGRHTGVPGPRSYASYAGLRRAN